MSMFNWIFKAIFGNESYRPEKPVGILPLDPEEFNDRIEDHLINENEDFGDGLIELIHKNGNTIEDYWTNGYVHKFYLGNLTVSICDQDTRWVGTYYRTPKTKEDEENATWNNYKGLDAVYLFTEHGGHQDNSGMYEDIRELLANVKKVKRTDYSNTYDPMVINGIKYDWRCNSVFGKYRDIQEREVVLYNLIIDFFQKNHNIATKSSQTSSLLMPITKDIMAYIWKIDNAKYELSLFPVGASQYDRERHIYNIQTDGKTWLDCVQEDGTPVYQDIENAILLLTEAMKDENLQDH